jgi:L,D-transpeptidase YcbB
VTNNPFKKLFVLLVSGLCLLSMHAQIAPAALEQFLADKKNTSKAELAYPAEVRLFYSQLSYKTVWFGKDNIRQLEVLLSSFESAHTYGLREKDYQFDFIKSFRNGIMQLGNLSDSIEAEIRFADAAIHFYSDIAYGNTKPALGYNGLDYIPGCRNIPVLLADFVSRNSLPLLTGHLSPLLPEVRIIENKIRAFLAVMADSNFSEVNIISNKVTIGNQPLLIKLRQLGIIDSINMKMPDSILKNKIREAQRVFDMMADGVLRSTITRELNVPLSVRLQELNFSINYYRWLSCLVQDQPVIVVNIPAAYLKVYGKDKVILAMRMVVGKPATSTPTFSSTVNEVILYPYWYVPSSIISKELLPAIKRNPGYIDAGNYQVLNSAGKILNPYSINWGSLSADNFPYTIRQSTGCDNSLGLLKLNFYTPYGVYLHDTPKKSLFMLNKRFFSHGCMRMEKPLELGHLVLKDNYAAIDTLTEKGCLRNQSPVFVHADVHMPVIAWYNPAGIDPSGRLVFFEDVYEKFDWLSRK